MPRRTCGPAIAKFKRWFFDDNEGSTEQWEGDYWKVLKHLPKSHPLSKPALTNWIQEYAPEPNTKKRLRACMAIRVMARQGAELELDTSKLQGKYQSIGPDPRTIPTDKQIIEVWETLQNPQWRWVWATVASYGLRPHEAFLIDLDRLRQGNARLHILNGKTGERYSHPYHPEWFHDFGLERPKLPNIKLDRTHQQIGHSATRYFWEQKTPFTLMALRHAWAIRTMLTYDVRDYFAAQWMGHSIEVHQRIYWRWISEQESQREFQRSLGRRDDQEIHRPQWRQKG